MKKLGIFAAVTLLVAMTFGAIPSGAAVTSSSNVVFIDDRDTGHGGSLPYTDAAFSAFTFTTMGWASVSAASLAPYDTVVLTPDTTTIPLTTGQKSDLVSWVSSGGKLIIYDSEVTPGPDYSWLPYPFTTNNPGAMGYAAAPIFFMESNRLGDNTNPMSPYYINTTVTDYYSGNYWSDYIGDCNTFATFDSNWCGDISAYNWFSDPQSPGYDGSPPSWTHAYAPYNDGMLIYNGFDIDPLSASTTPTSTGFVYPGTYNVGAGAKIFLLELQVPWGADWDLPCGVPPSGIDLDPLTATNIIGNYHTVTATIRDAYLNPVPGVPVVIQVISGPNAGIIASGSTDANGEFSFSYSGMSAGTDEIQAHFNCTQCTPPKVILSRIVEKIWETTAPGVPEFSLAWLSVASIAAVIYIAIRKRLGKNLE
ncbi:MAG: Ig-like domain-containing protein [Candidatus Bathyarchaeota archaeon]|nr:MAG: Ig-like domain-containing protein [Candidatus Bathyarchaeota archaeon]